MKSSAKILPIQPRNAQCVVFTYINISKKGIQMKLTKENLYKIIKPGIPRKKKAVYIFSALGFIALACGLIVLTRHPSESPQYDLETADEIDFTAPNIQAHTAADGVAVIGGTGQPARVISGPNGETSHTRSGFTIPVSMDGESIGVLTIPDIGLSVRVYDGEDEMELMKKGIAHFRHTTAWTGNIGLSAHNINFDGSPGYFAT